MEKKQYKCPNCGKICKTQRTLAIHKQACDMKYVDNKSIQDKPIRDEKVDSKKIRDEKEDVRDEKPLSIKQRAENLINGIKGGVINNKQKKETAYLFNQITNKPPQSTECPSCLMFMVTVIRNNLKKGKLDNR